MTNYDELIAAYEVDVRFPDVNGMEHLDMLLMHSDIAGVEASLTTEQRHRLAEADKLLFQQAKAFYLAIDRVATLADWRRTEDAPPAQWWWYLDVLARLPAYSVQGQPAAIATLPG